MASVHDTAVDGIVILDEGACVLDFNKARRRLFGYEAGEILHCNITKIICSEDADRPENLIPDYGCTDAGKIAGMGCAVMGRWKRKCAKRLSS